MHTKTLMLFLATLAIATTTLRAGDSQEELKARFEQRYPKLRELKQAGTIGETADGTVEFVKGGGDAAARELVDAENHDRSELYKLIAAKEGTTPKQVAEASARRHFSKARPGEWLKDPDGKWKQK